MNHSVVKTTFAPRHNRDRISLSPGAVQEWAAGNDARAGFTGGPQKPPVAPSVYGKTVLENGVRVITESVPGMRSVSIGVMVDCGAKDELSEQAGLAHLAEHLSFQGTSVRDQLQIARQIESFGHAGGFTTRDYTCYHATTLDDFQFHALELLGDVLLNPIFPEDCLVRERNAILSEMESGWDLPAQRVHDLAKLRVLPGQALGRPIPGTPETIARYTREDVIYFVQQHYTPDQIIIAAAGSLDHSDFTAQTRDAFWRLIGQSEPLPKAAPFFHGGVSVECTNTSQVYFCLMVPAPEYANTHRYAMHVLNWILGGGISSRLYQRLRDARGLVYSIGSEYQAYRDAGMISVEGSTSPDHLEEVVAAVLGIVAGLFSGREPAQLEELWRAKTHLRIQHAVASEDAHTRMCRLLTQELYFGRQIDAGTVLEHIEAVDPAALNNVSRLLCQTLPFSYLAVAGPVRSQQILTAFLKEMRSQMLDATTGPGRPPAGWSGPYRKERR